MTFEPHHFHGHIAEGSETQRRLFSQYAGSRTDFDLIVIGSGMGGGIFADDVVDRHGARKRVLVLEAGSFLFPTHVYNIGRLDNGSVARSFGNRNFWQHGGDTSERYIHEQPQLNFGGRSVFWSGLIPTIQPWELNFFPDAVKTALTPASLREAGRKMNESASMGEMAKKLVQRLNASPLSADFNVEETPRALHQPYLDSQGTPTERYFVEPTGVFSTAELLMNHLVGHREHDGNGLHLLLNQYVEDLRPHHAGYEIYTRDTLTGGFRLFHAPRVVLAAGSIESPKLLNRSEVGRQLHDSVRSLIGRGLTDHPTTNDRRGSVTHCGDLEIPKNDHAKIVLYSKGLPDGGSDTVKYPFNVEININHEYWHLHEIDPDARDDALSDGASILDLKFSFANCLDERNAVHPAPPYAYVPQIDFLNLNWTSHTQERLHRLAGWQRSGGDIFAVLNSVAESIFAQFTNNGAPAQPDAPLGQSGKGFGRGTVHHSVGTLRMPFRPAIGAPLSEDSVVDEDLEVEGSSRSLGLRHVRDAAQLGCKSCADIGGVGVEIVSAPGRVVVSSFPCFRASAEQTHILFFRAGRSSSSRRTSTRAG